MKIYFPKQCYVVSFYFVSFFLTIETAVNAIITLYFLTETCWVITSSFVLGCHVSRDDRVIWLSAQNIVETWNILMQIKWMIKRITTVIEAILNGVTNIVGGEACLSKSTICYKPYGVTYRLLTRGWTSKFFTN